MCKCAYTSAGCNRSWGWCKTKTGQTVATTFCLRHNVVIAVQNVVVTFWPIQIIAKTYGPGRNIVETFWRGKNVVVVIYTGQNIATIICPGENVVATLWCGQNIAMTFYNSITTFCPVPNVFAAFCPVLVLQPPRSLGLSDLIKKKNRKKLPLHFLSSTNSDQVWIILKTPFTYLPKKISWTDPQ